MKKEIVIINAFPNNDNKIKILQEQIFHLKKLNYPILVISGCDVPQSIISNIDYLLINKENEILDKKFNYNIIKYCKKMNISSPSTYFLITDDFYSYFYSKKVDSTIVKNIKLSFNLAKSLGYSKALYTEDDNIFKNEEYIKNNFQLIDNYKIAAYLTNEDNKYYKIYTTFFFVDVDFLLEKFTIPSNAEDWYKESNIEKYSLYKILEGSFYDILKNDIESLYNIENETIKLENEGDITLNTNTRNDDESFIIDNFFNVFDANKNKKFIHLFNYGLKKCNVDVYVDGKFFYNKKLGNKHWNLQQIPENIKEVKLIINNIEKTIHINNDIKYNGYIHFK